jgi:hypothetical protein
MDSKLSISPHMIKRITDTTKMVSSAKNTSVYSANNRVAMNSPSPPPQSIITAAAAAVAQQNINSSISQQPKPNQVSRWRYNRKEVCSFNFGGLCNNFVFFLNFFLQQVGTVLLYGIPIVSLYIEAQERLCLAQISNTLLKQFSYNEIHNRRVALGITCVQCTPVQLEILRRAGAMPVSSRRCGMITRREAERLCKSFLGDNAPPRLPDDFAFNVLHECAWGCRGSFLPSRYNSSRAKCIKCYYCGLFFSPNKFIFHSHRIGPNDKYVQPDAANFNSWRRHMKLSGTPDDFIIHSWEDVKAMFNGGTRKRLMVQSPISRAPAPSSPKKNKESTTMSPPLISTSITAVKTQNSVQLPIRPVNVHKSTSSTPQPAQTVNNSNPIRNVLPPAFQTDLPLPFSRSFMMDYMWHQHQNPHKTAPTGAASLIQFPTYALPWLKRPSTGSTNLLFPGQHAPLQNTAAEQPTNNGNSSPLPAHTNIDGSKQLNFYTNSSAFKPVLSLRKDEDVIKSVNKNNHHDHRQMKHYSEMSDDDTDDRVLKVNKNCSVFKESLSSDDEMVDIETTDDDYCEPTTTTSSVIGLQSESSPMHSNNSNGQNDVFCRMADSPVSTSMIRRDEEKVRNLKK